MTGLACVIRIVGYLYIVRIGAARHGSAATFGAFPTDAEEVEDVLRALHSIEERDQDLSEFKSSNAMCVSLPTDCLDFSCRHSLPA
eukprot:981032-Pleurochrysis_carterae.AAC.1